MNKGVSIIKLCGLEPVLELCRIETKHSGLFLYIPKALREKLDLNGEKSLIAYCDGNTLLLVKDSKIEEMLKPMILEMRQLYYSKLSEHARKDEEDNHG